MQYIDYYNAIKEKKLNELALKELAFVHLNGRNYSDIKYGQIYSVLPLVIREIRHAKFNKYSQNFLPIAAAFTILDQIGFCYSRNDMSIYSDANASSIKKSLYYFCGLSENDKDTKALYALRNSILHTASCLSKSDRKNQPNHRFVLDKDSADLVKYPEVEWDGDFENLDGNMSTIINPTMLVDLIEKSVGNALKCLYDDNLNVFCIGGGAEFYYRFLSFRLGKI